MTAEIAIMNKQAVALAADSAATLSTPAGPKILMANKIFALSKFQPVGVMVYGSAEFVGMPWESIVKTYRQELDETSFGRVTEYRDHFIEFLTRQSAMFPSDQQYYEFLAKIQNEFYSIARDARADLENGSRSPRRVTPTMTQRALARVINQNRQAQASADTLPGLPRGHRKKLGEVFGDEIENLIDRVFPDSWLSNASRRKLKAYAIDIGMKQPDAGDSGLVFAGFGENSIFPELAAIELDGLILDSMIANEGDSLAVTHEDGAFVVPFAQKEMVWTFMEGVDPDYAMTAELALDEILANYGKEIASFLKLSPAARTDLLARLDPVRTSLMDTFTGSLADYRRERLWMPVMNIVAELPKHELADMAESLVNLTSFKRRISTQAETVGGPIDVCVISRGDGLIWIKRKHYFEPEMNPHFLANYYR